MLVVFSDAERFALLFSCILLLLLSFFPIIVIFLLNGYRIWIRLGLGLLGLARQYRSFASYLACFYYILQQLGLDLGRPETKLEVCTGDPNCRLRNKLN
jgi:hypothetical protein